MIFTCPNCRGKLFESELIKKDAELLCPDCDHRIATVGDEKELNSNIDNEKLFEIPKEYQVGYRKLNPKGSKNEFKSISKPLDLTNEEIKLKILQYREFLEKNTLFENSQIDKMVLKFELDLLFNISESLSNLKNAVEWIQKNSKDSSIQNIKKLLKFFN